MPRVATIATHDWGDEDMNRKKIIGLTAAACVAMVPTAALAGETVYGSGGSRVAAMDDAEARGRVLARERGTCITTHAMPQNCKQDSGGWMCWVVVANHRGSC